MAENENEGNPQYIGDGVYVETEGNWAIKVRVNHHLNPVAVTLEDTVLQSLVDYARANGFEVK